MRERSPSSERDAITAQIEGIFGPYMSHFLAGSARFAAIGHTEASEDRNARSFEVDEALQIVARGRHDHSELGAGLDRSCE